MLLDQNNDRFLRFFVAEIYFSLEIFFQAQNFYHFRIGFLVDHTLKIFSPSSILLFCEEAKVPLRSVRHIGSPNVTKATFRD